MRKRTPAWITTTPARNSGSGGLRHSRARRVMSGLGAMVLALTMLTLVSQPASAAVAFGQPTDYPISGYPFEAAAGDFNGDGHPDLAVATSDNGVWLLINDGRGSFASGLNYPTNGAATSIVVGDFNGDEKLDLAVTLLPGRVAVFDGDGFGALGAPTSYPVPSDALSIATGDFNNDGRLDLVTASGASELVAVLSNEGSGFGPATHYDVRSVTGVAVGDFDTDGWLDVAVTQAGLGQVSVLHNTEGSFVKGSDARPGGVPLALAVGHLDKDGKPDVVVAHESGEVSVLGSDFVVVHQQILGGRLTGVAVGDFDGDGKADVAVSDLDSGSVSVLAGTGTGSLGSPDRFPSGAGDNWVTTADVNVDGRLDLVLPQKDNLAILLNTTTGPIASLTPTSLSFGDQVVQTSSDPHALTLQNTGTVPLVITGMAIAELQTDFALQRETCGSSLEPGQSCTVELVFTPTATGSRVTTLSVTTNAAGSPHQAQLSGNGIAAAPVVRLSPSSLSFGARSTGTTSEPQVVTVANTGTAPLTASSVATSGANQGDFAVSDTTCLSGSIEPENSCTIAVTFTPTGAGVRTAILEIADNAAGSPHTASLGGTGVIQADVGVSVGATPNPVRTTTNLTYTVAVTNHGPSTATGVVLTDTLPSGSQFLGHEAPGATCTVPARGATGTLTCNFPSLPVGTTTVTIVVKIVAPGGTTVTNTASVNSSSDDTNAANNSATVQTAVFGRK